MAEIKCPKCGEQFEPKGWVPTTVLVSSICAAVVLGAVIIGVLVIFLL